MVKHQFLVVKVYRLKTPSCPSVVYPARKNHQVQPFVVFTVCNINPYKFNVIKSSPVYADLQKLLEDYQRMVDVDYGDIENDRFGLNVRRLKVKWNLT